MLKFKLMAATALKFFALMLFTFMFVYITYCAIAWARATEQLMIG
jgi:hypothetical protein